MGLMDEAFGSKHLSAKDLDGMEHTVTMDSVNLIEFDRDGGGKEKKLELHIMGWDKSLILNKTNGKMIESFCGDDSTWAGQQIVMFPTQTQFGHELKDCIRVRQPLRAAPQATGTQSAAADDVPFN